MVDSDSSENVMYAYIEKDSEVTVNEEGNVLNIHFDEPDESEDITVQTIEFNQSPAIDTLNFYINDEEVPLESIIYE